MPLNSEYGSVAQGSIEKGPSSMFDRVLSFPWLLNMLGLENTRVGNIFQGYTGILNDLSFEHATVLNVSGV